jgi:hypothetical protein
MQAQDIIGTITGTVKDSSGAAIAGATVTASNLGTNPEVTEGTSARGSFEDFDMPNNDVSFFIDFAPPGLAVPTGRRDGPVESLTRISSEANCRTSSCATKWTGS